LYFDVVGPFEYNRDPRDNRWKDEFWEDVEGKWEGLSHAFGCYVFSIRFGEKFTPWYVGKTVAEDGYRAEVFQDHKLVHFSDAIEMGGRGSAQITFIPMVTRERWALSYANKSGEGAVEWLERTLIGMCLAKNPKMRNSKDTRFSRDVFLNGILGEPFAGRPTKLVAHARKLLR
jgi:hypothetical protein